MFRLDEMWSYYDEQNTRRQSGIRHRRQYGANAAMNADHVEGLVNYLEYMGERPVIYLYKPPPGVPIRSGDSVKHTIRVYDGRQVADRLTLDSQGFAFMRHESAVVNFYDPDEVR